MFTVDTQFPEFSVEAYDPQQDEAVTISNVELLGKWVLLFFYPADFTYVCPTELADLARRKAEFNNYSAEVIVASTDSVYTHKAWLAAEALLKDFDFPMISDRNGKLSKALDIYDEEKGLSQRAAFIIDPNGVLRAVDIVGDTIGRSAGELLRKLKALHFVENNPGKVCPASWDEGAATLTPSLKISGRVGQALQKSAVRKSETKKRKK